MEAGAHRAQGSVRGPKCHYMHQKSPSPGREAAEELQVYMVGCSQRNLRGFERLHECSLHCVFVFSCVCVCVLKKVPDGLHLVHEATGRSSVRSHDSLRTNCANYASQNIGGAAVCCIRFQFDVPGV